MSISHLLGENPHAVRDPYYTAMFRDRPQDAAREYTKLFHSDDAKIIAFMFAFPYRDPTPQQLQLLWLSRFPVVLLDSLSNSKWYESFRVMAAGAEYGRVATSQSLQFELAVRSLVALMLTAELNSSMHKPILEECCECFPRFWELMWRYRGIVLSAAFNKATKGVLECVGELMERHFSIYPRRTSEPVPPLESYLPHVALHFLVNPSYFRTGHTACEPSYLVGGAIHHVVRMTSLSAREHPFFHEVVPEVVGRGGGFAQIIRRNLVHGRPIGPEEFRWTLDLVGLLLRRGPTILTPESSRSHSEVLSALAAAAQKYDCHGCALPPQTTECSGCGPTDMAKAFVDAYSGLIKNLPHAEAEKLMDNDLRDHAYHIDFAHSIARSVGALDMNRKAILEFFVVAYINISRGRTSYRTGRARWRNYCRLRRILQVYWLPTLKDIRTTLHPSRSQANPSETVPRAELQDMLKRWEDLGRAFNLSDRSREDDWNLTDYVTAEELALGCFYSECLCYGEKPLHGIRRVCKGCWSVYYCGPRCQKKDWEAGHKNTCGGRSTARHR